MRVLFIPLLFLIVCSCGSKEELIFPKIRTITSSIYASATVLIDSVYIVYSTVGGNLERTQINEGDKVTAETPLFKMTNVTSKSKAQNAFGRYLGFVKRKKHRIGDSDKLNY